VDNLAEPAPARDLAALATEAWASLLARDPLAPRLPAAARARLELLERDRDQTLDQALLRLVLADPVVATTLPGIRDPGHLAELAAAPDLPPPTPDDLERLAELGQARFGLEEETTP
jgi:hypothetical protein